MYLVGASHPHKTNAQRLLEKLIREHQRLVTNAEVLQEILHRYVAMNRRDAIQPAFDALTGWSMKCLPSTERPLSAQNELFSNTSDSQLATPFILP
jgi:predicted nucleic acid-binding protein